MNAFLINIYFFGSLKGQSIESILMSIKILKLIILNSPRPGSQDSMPSYSDFIQRIGIKMVQVEDLIGLRRELSRLKTDIPSGNLT